MAKPNVSKLNADSVNEAANELLVKGESSQGISWGEAFDFAESQSVEKMQALSGAEWLKLDDKGTYTFAFMGMGVANPDGEETKVVKLTNKDGKEFISSLAVLLSVCSQLKQIPTFIKIVYEQDKKGANGTYKDLKIFSL